MKRTKQKAAPAAKKKTASGKRAPETEPAKPASPKRDLILALIERDGGATISEVMQATSWQAHSVRGFMSTIGRKTGKTVVSSKTETGERNYELS